MRTRRAAILLGAAVAAAAVAGSAFFVPRTVRCGGDPRTDLSREPDYAAKERLHRWTAPNGCPARLDIIMTREGPAHCGWTEVRDILIGTPLGTSANKDARIYVRDPMNVLGDRDIATAFDEDVTLPPDATETGYVLDDAELWTVPSGEAIYIVSSWGTERWPLDLSPAGCA